MKTVKLLETDKGTIRVLGVAVFGKSSKLHIKIDGVDILENVDAHEVEVTLDREDSVKGAP